VKRCNLWISSFAQWAKIKWFDCSLCLFSHAGYSPRPPTSSDRNEILHGGWSTGGNSEVRFHQNWLDGFIAVWDRNLPFHTDLAVFPSVWWNPWERANFDHPPTATKPLKWFWWNTNCRTVSWRSANMLTLISIWQRGWSRWIPSMTEKTKFNGYMFPPGSAETLARRGGTTNHHSTGYSLSKISAKNYWNRSMCVEVIACNISVIFRHSALPVLMEIWYFFCNLQISKHHYIYLDSSHT